MNKIGTVGSGSIRGNVRVAIMAAAGLVIVAAAFFFVPSFGEDKPNIIIISIDTLRHDHLGYRGYTPENKSPSPFIDTLAREGAVFTRASSTTTWTLPGHCAMLTGTPDQVHGVVDDRIPYDARITTITQALNDLGYATGGFFSAPYMHRFFGFSRGFDKYWSCMSEDTMYDRLNEWKDMSKEQASEEVAIREVKSHLDVTSDTVTNKALFFAKTHKDEPLFLFLHYFDVHNDYLPRPPFDKRFDPGYSGWVDGRAVLRNPDIKPDMDPADLKHLIALYDGEIAWVDHNISKLFESIDSEILENSIVVITSDHGEEFFEHGMVGHRGNLYDPTLRIPLLFWSPGRIPQGMILDAPVRIYDIFPTVFDLAGYTAPDTVYGTSLAPLLRNEPFKPEPVMAELVDLPPEARQTGEFRKYLSYQNNSFKLIKIERRKWSPDNAIDFNGELLEESYELYNIDDDPNELNNLYSSAPEMAEVVMRAYEKELDRMAIHRAKINEAGPINRSSQDLPEWMTDRLEQLGYGTGSKTR